MAKKRRRTTQKRLNASSGDRFHHDDGTHRATAPTTNGRLLEQWEKGMRRHRADGHTHEPIDQQLRAAGRALNEAVSNRIARDPSTPADT